jgi:hypothetical protein
LVDVQGSQCINFAQKDPGYLLDLLAHERTHKMQSCAGGFLMPPTHVVRMMREVRFTISETLYALDAYPSSRNCLELKA